MKAQPECLCPWLLAVALLAPALAHAGGDDGGPPSMHVAIDYRLDLPRESGGMRCTPVRLSVQWEGELKPTDRAPDGKRPALLFREHGPLRANVEGVRTCTNPDDGTTTVHRYQTARDATGVVTLELFTEVDAGRWEPLPRLSLQGFTDQPSVFFTQEPDGDFVAHFGDFEFAPKGVVEGSALIPDFGFSEAEFRNGFKKTLRFWSELGPGDAVESGTVTFSYKNGLRAIPVVASTVNRGETIVLDGRKSEGNPKRYEWKFKPKAADGATADAINANAVKEGARTSVVLLDSVDITLRVSDGKSWDEKTVSVSVLPREQFRTRFEHVAQEVDLPDSDPPIALPRSVGVATRGRKLFDAEWTGAGHLGRKELLPVQPEI